MSLIKRLFGSAKTPDTDAAADPEPETPSRLDAAPDSRTFQLDSAQAGTRRELVRVVTRDTLRAAGIPEGWIESQVLLELGRGDQTFVHLRLVVKQWDVRLLKFAVAFQNRLMAEIELIDPTAQQWLLSISWQYQVGASCPFQDLPDPAVWRAPAATIEPEPVPAPAPAPVPIPIPVPVPVPVPAARPEPEPEPAALQSSEVDLLLEVEEPDELSEDLARLFAIRDANLPAHGAPDAGADQTPAARPAHRDPFSQ